jgi:hypothetical protein
VRLAARSTILRLLRAVRFHELCVEKSKDLPAIFLLDLAKTFAPSLRR